MHVARGGRHPEPDGRSSAVIERVAGLRRFQVELPQVLFACQATLRKFVLVQMSRRRIGL